ncbi:MAG: YfhO family protein [Oscillospiraceae bacterium]
MKVLKSKAFMAFCFGFMLYILTALPELITYKGILLFGSDYRNQSLPFTYHIRDCILSGNVIWDHSSGLGSQFLSSYAFYNLFSPFTLLYLIIPRDAVVYAMPYITALKYGLGTMLAYFYAARFLKNKNYAVLAGLLYRFSTASAYNLIFHFEDVFTFFPLLLIALEELCTKNRKGVFAVTAGFLALLNCYFFVGETVFAVIYFFIRGACDKQFGLSVKKSLQVLFEGIIGVMCVMVFLLPVGITLIGGSRATNLLQPSDWLAYDSIYTYLKIIQSAFMIPDPFGYYTMFPTYGEHYPFGTIMSSVAAYLPLFSLTGVISYIVKKRKSWESILLSICAVMALVPVLNQLFSALNNIYYARWFFMPLLIAAVVSMKALEEEISFKPGLITCGAVFAGLVIYQLVVDTMVLVLENIDRGYYNGALNIVHLVITGICLAMVILIVRLKRDREYFPKLFILSAVGIYMCFGIMFFSAVSDFYDKNYYISKYELKTEKPEQLNSDDRICIPIDSQNFNLIWQNNSTSFFNSLVNKGYVDFVEANEVSGGYFPSASLRVTEYVSLTDFVSMRYAVFINEDISVLDNYTKVAQFGNYGVYENTGYIPLGRAYDKMISYEDFMELELLDKHRSNMKYVVAKDTSLFEGVLQKETPASQMTTEEYKQHVENRRAESSYYEEQTKDGLISNIKLPEKRVVLYTISNDGGWTAYIDGEEAEVYDVNNGLIGVIVPEGDHEVVLRYRVQGFAAGCVISAAAVAVLVGYILISRRKSAKAGVVSG